MKILNTLDKIVIEIAIEDFENNNLKLGEVTRVLSKYEEQHFDTSKYRVELNNIMANKYVNELYNQGIRGGSKTP